MYTRGSLRAALLVAFLTLTLAPAASAKLSLATLIGSGGGQAKWVVGVDAPGDTDGQALRLVVPHAGSYAGFHYEGVPAGIPSTAPSFELKPMSSGPAAGSPRLVIAFASGDYVYASPDAWTPGAWSKVGGSNPDWHDAGLAGCPALDDVTYGQAITCAQADGQAVSAAYLVDDTAGTNGTTVYVDDVSLDGLVVTDPGNVGAAQAHRTKLTQTVKVNRHGVGHLHGSCGVKPGPCHFSMKLRLRQAGQTVTVGKLKGTVDYGSRHTRVKLSLNAKGGGLLASRHRLSVTATGRWPSTGQVKRLRLTITS